MFPSTANAAVVLLRVASEDTPSAANLQVTALPGESNRLSVERAAAGAVIIRDDGAPLHPGDNCRGGPIEVTCSTTAVLTGLNVSVSAGDGSDQVSLEGLGSDVGGYVRGGLGADTIIGGAGPDVFEGHGGDDRLVGGGGDDRLGGFEGADVLRGGAGIDTADYFERDASVRVTLDDRPDDGAIGEADDVGLDVENVRGGRGADYLEGSDAPNFLEGGEGDDELVGGAGDDTLEGSSEVEGGRFVGGAGRDTLLVGNASVIDVRDGESDVVRCAAYLTRPLQGDAIDVLRSCVPFVKLDRASARVTASGHVKLRFRCDAVDQACRLLLELRHRDRRLARVSLQLDPGRPSGSIPLNARGRRLLKRQATVRVTARLQSVRVTPAPSEGRRFGMPLRLERAS